MSQTNPVFCSQSTTATNLLGSRVGKTCTVVIAIVVAVLLAGCAGSPCAPTAQLDPAAKLPPELELNNLPLSVWIDCKIEF